MQDNDTGADKGNAGTTGAKRNPRIGIVAAVAVAVALVVAVCVFAVRPASEPDSGEAASPVSEAGFKDAGLREVTVTVVAEGAEDAAVDATYELTDADGEVVEEGPIAAGDPVGFELEDGSYSFELLTTPVLEDGATYGLPDEPTAIEVSEGMEESDFEIELSRIAADDMTAEQLEAVAAELDAAAAAREQAASAPSVSGSADSVKRDPAPSGGSSQGSSNPGSGATTPSAPSGGSGSSGSGTAAEPDPEPSQPAHEHSWVAQTEQRYVVDTAAWDEQIPYSVWKCLKCNITFSNEADATAHAKNAALSGDFSHNFTTLTQYETVHHPEVGHWETATTGYKCSGCGAWQ